VPFGSADDPLLEEHEALIDVGDRGLLGLQLQPECLHSPGQLVQQGLRLRLGPPHEQDQVIGVPNEAVCRTAFAVQGS
jgi:hypothetical protein